MVENSTTFFKKYFSDGLERLNKFNIESAHQVFFICRNYEPKYDS